MINIMGRFNRFDNMMSIYFIIEIYTEVSMLTT